jgi:hypothetical protein
MALLCVVVLIGLVFAAPAAAQLRDPFEPLVEEGATAGTTTGETTGGTTTVQPGPATEAEPTTGADPSPYLMVAYALVAIGAGAIVIAKTLQPVAARR